jgi:acyl-CoA synthetase (AMP-forming)/AMP-acid ligase II
MDLSVTTNISKGGENIYPLEIEERLVQHPAIARAIVVGISHPKYVEVPVGFLLLADNIPAQKKPDLEEVKSWVRQCFGWARNAARMCHLQAVARLRSSL